jgi:adenylyltransferase/sulfurtransferase
MPFSPAELTRYSRHLTLREVGEEGQRKLKAARVLVIGAGGLGSPSALYLAASGVGTIGLLDCDRVELSNLQRQVLFDTRSLSLPKAEAARERLRALNPEIEVVAHAVELRAGNALELLRPYDVVLDGTDRIATRYLINDACVILRKPLVAAAIHRFEGHVMTCVPGAGPCYRCLFPEAPVDLIPNCADAGVLGVLPGVLGTIQATEAIKLITDIGEPLIGRLLIYDALKMRFQELHLRRRDDCAVCGERPTITRPLAAAASPENSTADPMQHITASQLRQLLAQPQARLSLIDVREPYEFEAGHIEGAINIPLSELPARLDEVSPQTVFICAVGGRSAFACSLAERAGIDSPVNLEGGMRAWLASD